MTKKTDNQNCMHQHGRWISSMLDGWMCPGEEHGCSGDHKAGDCDAARQLGQRLVAAEVKF